MAIQKDKTLSSGVTGNYWKITNESYDKKTLACVVDISLFLDQAHGRNSSALSLGLTKRFIFSATRSELLGDRTALCYSKIKAQAAEMIPVLGSNPPATAQRDPDLVGGIDV